MFIQYIYKDIPCLYSTFPCISGYCGHCSSIILWTNESISLHPARPIGHTAGGKCYICIFAMRPTDGRPPSRTTGLSVADTEDHQTELQADGLGRAVETRERRTGQKAAKRANIDENRVCKYLLWSSHTYLISTKISYGCLESVQTRIRISQEPMLRQKIMYGYLSPAATTYGILKKTRKIYICSM